MCALQPHTYIVIDGILMEGPIVLTCECAIASCNSTIYNMAIELTSSLSLAHVDYDENQACSSFTALLVDGAVSDIYGISGWYS